MTLAIIPVPILLFWMPGQLIQLIVFTGTTEAMMNAETIRAVQVARARPRARSEPRWRTTPPHPADWRLPGDSHDGQRPRVRVGRLPSFSEL